MYSSTMSSCIARFLLFNTQSNTNIAIVKRSHVKIHRFVRDITRLPFSTIAEMLLLYRHAIA